MAITGLDLKLHDVFLSPSDVGGTANTDKVMLLSGKTATDGVRYYIVDDDETTPLLTNQGIKVAKTTLTNAQIKACRATPVTLIAAPGANYINVVVSILARLNAGSEVLTESADNLAVQYTDSGQDIVVIESTGFIDQAADEMCVYYPEDIANFAPATIGVNEAIEVFNNGDGEIAGNASADATLDIWITYHTLYVG